MSATVLFRIIEYATQTRKLYDSKGFLTEKQSLICWSSFKHVSLQFSFLPCHQEPSKRTSIYYTGPKRTRPSPRGPVIGRTSVFSARQTTEGSVTSAQKNTTYNPLVTVIGRQGNLEQGKNMERHDCLMINIFILCGVFIVICGGSLIICGAYVIICGGFRCICGGFFIICGARFIICGSIFIMRGAFLFICGVYFTICGDFVIMCGAYYTICCA